MIVGVLPFIADGFGHEILAYLVVDVRFMGLAELVAPSHIEHLAVFDEMGARLVETEWDTLTHHPPTLPQLFHPDRGSGSWP